MLKARHHVFAALRNQVASGDLGRKTGKGFLHPGQPGPAPTDAQTIALRIETTRRPRRTAGYPRRMAHKMDKNSDTDAATDF